MSAGKDPPRAELQAIAALHGAGDDAAAVARAEALLSDHPQSFLLLNLLGTAQLRLAQRHAAQRSFRQAVRLEPRFAPAHANLGFALLDAGDPARALAGFDRALSQSPDFAQAASGRGNALKALGRLEEAVAALEHAVALEPDFAEAHFNLGSVLQQLGEPAAALAAFRRALGARPDFAVARLQVVHMLAQLCDWHSPDRFGSHCAQLGIEGDPVPPFALLACQDNPQAQMVRAQRWAARAQPRPPAPPAPAHTRKNRRLRIGYFGADFHDHATLWLLAGMLREHDRAEFEVYLYSYGKVQDGPARAAAKRNASRFFDIAAKSDAAVIRLAREHRLDIAIDLKGFTQDSHWQLFSQRLAPVQVGYLGYPGTMGAGFMDYLVADPVTIPLEQREHYAERVIRLPHAYQPNDDAREIAAGATYRADFGLPPHGFVFCCFNAAYKIGPREFAIWMRLLKRVEGSVLWLMRPHPLAADALRREARSHGIDPARLVFAETLPHSQHLARHRHADLFLDTFACNAHTTASDALWAGLPLVTLPGRQFAARVGASLLTALELPELIARDEAHYEELAFDLSTRPELLREVREKIADKRGSAPLFDTRRYTRHFEAALGMIHARWREGAAPTDIDVPDRFGPGGN